MRYVGIFRWIDEEGFGRRRQAFLAPSLVFWALVPLLSQFMSFFATLCAGSPCPQTSEAACL